jgi:recombination protein RecA
MFGSPETTTGGRALKFYASVRLDIRRTTQIKDGENIIGGRTRVKVAKNKMAPPFKDAEFDIIYGHGISREGDILDLGVEHKLIDKSGSWFSYKGERLGQGRENAKSALAANPEMLNKLDHELRIILGLIPADPAAPPAPEKPVEAAPATKAGKVKNIEAALGIKSAEPAPVAKAPESASTPATGKAAEV